MAKHRQFFANSAERMTYAHFLARGLPISSNPVEAARKSLVRLRCSGMRWPHPGDQRDLNLRTVAKSYASQ